MSKKVEKKQDELENVEHVLTTSEAFIEKYQKQIFIGVGAIVLVVLVALSVRNFYLEPREVAAQNEMYKSQAFFAADSFRVALEGNEPNSMGFKQIASEYGFTASGKLASAYAGICYFKLGDTKKALDLLKSYDGSDKMIAPSVTGLIGDCLVNEGKVKDGIGYFEKAASQADNEVISPVYLKKAGLAYESLNQPKDAVKAYTTIKEKYFNSLEAADIDKYIARASAK